MYQFKHEVIHNNSGMFRDLQLDLLEPHIRARLLKRAKAFGWNSKQYWLQGNVAKLGKVALSLRNDLLLEDKEPDLSEIDRVYHRLTAWLGVA